MPHSSAFVRSISLGHMWDEDHHGIERCFPELNWLVGGKIALREVHELSLVNARVVRVNLLLKANPHPTLFVQQFPSMGRRRPLALRPGHKLVLQDAVSCRTQAKKYQPPLPCKHRIKAAPCARGAQRKTGVCKCVLRRLAADVLLKERLA